MDKKLSRLRHNWQVNLVGLLSCWLSLWLGFTVLFLFNSLSIGLQLIEITPLYYFLFDIHPLHNQVRSGQFNKTKVITALTKYLHRQFNMLWGGFIADVVGILYAIWQMNLNGFCLLFLDTFVWRGQHDPQEALLQNRNRVNWRYERAIKTFGAKEFNDFVEQEVTQVTGARKKEILRKNLRFRRYQYFHRLDTASKFASVRRYYQPMDIELKLTDDILLAARTREKEGNNGQDR